MSFIKKIYTPFFKRGNTAQYITYLFSIYYHYKYSFSENKIEDLLNDKTKLNFYLTKHYHIIEKGLALPNPRLGFGQPKIIDIIKKGTIFIERYGVNNTIFCIKECLTKYIEFNKQHDLAEDYLKKIKMFVSLVEQSSPGGVKLINKKDIIKKSNIPFAEFVKSRNSVRDFADMNVDENLVLQAVEIAKYAPSVCNRQSWHVHYYKKKEKILEMLSYQNGNSGFTNSINQLLVITGNIKGFTKFEHNQLFIDGGLFSMNLMLALHSLGIGSCPLNTCCDILNEKEIKKVGGISDSERLVMYIGIGYLKDEYKVAISERISTDDIVCMH